MSAKRQATSDLNHDNWEDEDPKEEAGGFKIAPKEVLEKRVIRTAKRRSQTTAEGQKSIFSGFSGFNKTQKTSFDFLANLTNGSKTNSETTAPKSDTAAVSSSSTVVKPASSPSSGIFSLSGTSTPTKKSTFVLPPSESTQFGESVTVPVFTQSVFSSSKPDSTVNDSPFKAQSLLTSTPNANFTVKPNPSSNKPIPQESPTLFKVPSTTAYKSSPFSSKTNDSKPLKTPVTSSSLQPNEVNKSPIKDTKENKNMIYYNNLRSLNECVSAWIKKHVDETPLCILTPIFRDYEKHLKDIEDEYEKSKEQSPEKILDTKPTNNTEIKSDVTSLGGSNLGSTLFSKTTTPANSIFTTTTTVEKTSNFSFGINTTTTVGSNQFLTTTVPSTGFTFGIKSVAPVTPVASATPIASTSPFASTNTTTNAPAPFSFGIGKPFAFNSNIKKSDEPANTGNDNEDEPPKVEYTPIAEENSVYDKKCKVFVKKDDNYVDKGVGTLYIKKIEESGKYQLLVRANTSLGNILINMVLSTSIPTQRMGKNNVMMVCIPTPDTKPPPTSILIRVKTSEDADELLTTLNKFKA